MSSLVPDDTPMLSDGAQPPADALRALGPAAAAGKNDPAAMADSEGAQAAVGSGAPVVRALVVRGPAVAALPMSASVAALPTHMLAAWSSPSSAASSAASSASTSPISSRRSSFSSVVSFASDCASIAAEAAARFPPPAYDPHVWRSLEEYELYLSNWCSAAAKTIIAVRTAAALAQQKDQPVEEEDEEEEEEGKNPRQVLAGHRSNAIGGGEEAMLLEKLRDAKARGANMGDAQRHGTNDRKTDLTMRPKSGFMHVYYSIQVKVSGLESNGRYLPAKWAVDYEGIVMWYHNTHHRFILVGLAEEMPLKSGGVPSLLKRAEHLLVTYKEGPEELERGCKEAVGILINRIADSAVYEKPDLTENQRTEQKGLGNIHRLCSRHPSMRYAPSDDGHSKHDFIVGDELMQMKSLSYKSESNGLYKFPLHHRVNGGAGVSYDTNMGLALVVVECKTGFYMLTPQQAAAEGLTGVTTLNPSKTLPRPDKCSPEHPFFKYIFPVPKQS